MNLDHLGFFFFLVWGFFVVVENWSGGFLWDPKISVCSSFPKKSSMCTVEC